MSDDQSSSAELPGPIPPAPPSHEITDSIAAAMLGVGRPGSVRVWEPPSPEELQASFPQYEIREMRGRGGMGAVYKGWQKSLDRFVAIKILAPGCDDGGGAHFDERFIHEAKALAQLKHPGIVAAYDAGETADGLRYFVMEYVEGTNVHELVAAQGRLPPEQALSITVHVCDALAYAHGHGVIHRDIKPANIMIDGDGQVKVADFGLARTAADGEAKFTADNQVMGTPDFTAPEAFTPGVRLDGRADLYAVGVMLYQMLTGTIPRGCFVPASGSVVRLDPRVDAVVEKAMQSDRDLRYSTAAELRADVDRILAGSRDQTDESAALTGPSIRGKAWHWIAAIAVVVGIVWGVAWWGRRSHDGGGDATVASADAVLAGKGTDGGIPRLWKPILPNLGARMDRDAVHLMHFETWGAPNFRMANAAVRAVIAWQPSPPGRNEMIKVKARWTNKEHYFACVYGPVVELGHYRDPDLTTLKRWTIEPPPKPGEAISLQLACVGRHLAVWIRDRLVGVLDDDTLVHAANVGVQAVDGHIQRLEYVDLDGISDAEAFQRLGLDARGSAQIERSSTPKVR